MAANQRKPKSSKQGTSASNLLASIPWLKNKTFLIPGVAFVLVLSTVGVVLAVQGGVFSSSAPGTADTSLEDSDAEAVEQPAIGFACVAGTEICEEVKSILLDTNYEEVLTNWTRESLIAHLEYKYGRSRGFATDVVDAIKFDWGDGSSDAGGSDSGSSTQAGSGNSTSTAVGAACVRGQDICEAAKYVLIETDQGKSFTRENFIEVWMSTYKASREKVEAIVNAIGFTNWAGSASSGGTSSSGGSAAPPPVVSQSGLSPSEVARSIIESINAYGSAYSRLQVIDYMVSLYKINRTDATSALDALGVNWNLQAAKAAKWFSTQAWTSYRSKVGWQEILEDEERFTASEAEYAINSINLDWSAQASRAGKWMLENNHCMAFVVQSEFGPSADIDDLASYIMGTFDFTEDEAYYGAMDQVEMEGDWVWKIFPNCVP
jgi:hypothetical protein